MSGFAFLKNTSPIHSSWWRRTYQAVVDHLVAGLRWRFGLDELNARIATVEQQFNNLAPAASTWAVSSWIEQTTLENTPLVSVILPTHNRSGLLRRAVESVEAQDYRNWEIVLVDDGSTDDTPTVINSLKRLGGKLQTLRTPQRGVCAARNHGLNAARGEFIAYLDDDNTMHPLWLKSVVWAFLQRPEIDVVYGGIMVDDFLRLSGGSAGGMPSFHLNPFDEKALRHYNLADIGAIAHRRNLPEASFDETLQALGDWDLLARLTRERRPLVLPVIACFYTTSAPSRLTDDPSVASEIRRVQEKLQR